MKHLANQFFALHREQRRLVILHLAKRSLQTWKQQFPEGTDLQYAESITGSMQTVELNLPEDAINEIENSDFDACVEERYQEPIVALHDMDWALPEQAELAYYGIYNAHRLLKQQATVEEKLVLNQLLSALPESVIEHALQEALNEAN